MTHPAPEIDDTDRLFSTKEVAEYLGICPRSVIFAVHQGELHGVRRGRRRLAFRGSDVHRYIRNLPPATRRDA